MLTSLISVKAEQDLRYTDQITGDQFEDFMTQVLNGIGYHDVIHTSYSNDGGVDAYSLTDGIAWQFKDYDKNRTVPYHAVEEITNGFLIYGTKINVVLTNSYFSHNTYNRCCVINQRHLNFTVKLIDRRKLFYIFEKYEKHQIPVIKQIKQQKQNQKQQHIHKRIRDGKIRQIKIQLNHIQYVHDKKIKRIADQYNHQAHLRNLQKIKFKRQVNKHNEFIMKLKKVKEKQHLRHREALRIQEQHQMATDRKLFERANYDNNKHTKRIPKMKTNSMELSNPSNSGKSSLNKHNFNYKKAFDSLPYIICPNCQAHLSPSTKFCKYCDFKFHDNDRAYELYMLWLVGKRHNNLAARLSIYLYYNYQMIFNILHNYLTCLLMGFIIGMILNGHVLIMTILGLLIPMYFHRELNDYKSFIKRFKS